MADEGASVDTQVKAGSLSRFASLTSTMRAPIRAPRDSVLLLVLAAVWLFFYFATKWHLPHPAQSSVTGASDLHRQPRGYQRRHADRYP
jgi:hypothetical protein